MFSKLRSNYQLSNLIVRILFVVAFLFCNWQDLLASSKIVLSAMDVPTSLTVPVMILSSLLTAVLIMIALPFLINMLLNMFKFYNIPRAEYNLIALLFVAIGLFACGILNLVHLFTPLLLTWGGVLFPFLVSLSCVIAFYKVTSRLYFNDVTQVYYFRSVAIVYFVTAFLMGVVA